jgi:hypothetical protein
LGNALEAAPIPENIAPSIVALCLPSMQVSGKIYSYPRRRFLDFRSPD